MFATTRPLRTRSPAVPTLAALALCAPGCGRAADEGPALPLPAGTPVVLIVIDTLRADHLSSYGYELPTSPVIDAFAREATLFEANTTQSNSTYPSMTSIMTGLYARTHRNYLAVPVAGRVQSNRDATSLAERLGAAGYATFAAVSHPGWTRDEENSSWFGTQLQGAVMRGWDELSMISADIPIELRPRAGNARYTNQRVFELLDGHEAAGAERPLFLWAHYFDPHTDLFPFVYYPPPEYWNLYLRHHLERVGQADVAGELARVDPAERAGFLKRHYGADPGRHKAVAVANGRSLYDAEISYCDWEVGRLFERLRRMGVYDRALVVIMADHGENMEGPELERPTFTFTHEKLYEGVVHTPLLIKLPGQTEARRVDQLTQNIDVLPTVLELLGMPVDPPVEGRSLVPLLLDGSARVHDEVYVEASNDPERAVKTDAFKLIDYSGGDEEARVELFRWRDDETESEDLSTTIEPRVLDRLQDSIERFKPRDSVRVRFLPDAQPYEVSFRVQLTQGRFEEVLARDAPPIGADGRDFAHRVQVGDQSEDVILALNRRNVQQVWTLEHSAGRTFERVYLGRLPVRATAAIPLWEAGGGDPPQRPLLVLGSDGDPRTLSIGLRAPAVERVELDLRYFQGSYSESVEVLEARGVEPEVRREGSVHHLLHQGGEDVWARLRLSSDDALLSVRLDGLWPDPQRISLNGRAVQPEPLRFVIPFPLDGRITSAMTVSPEEGEVPPGSIVIWYESGGGGGEIDTAGMDPALVEQLRTLGYVR